MLGSDTSLRLVLVMGAVLLAAPIEAQKLCAGLSGRARTDCLEAEKARGKQELERIERNNRRLDRAHDVACVARDFGGHVAGSAAGVAGGVAGGAPGTVGGYVGGKAVYSGAAGASDRVLGNSHPCTKRAR